jgi:YVTN family beta-propeller protein
VRSAERSAERKELIIRLFAVRLLLLTASLAAVAGDASAQGALAFRDANGRVLLFDVISLDLIDGLPTGGEVRDVTVSPDGRYAYVASRARTRASIDSTGSSILVFDLWSRSLETVFDLGAFTPTKGLRLNRRGSRLWVPAEEDGSILELNAQNGEFLMIWKTGTELNHRADVTPDDRRLYVANILDDVVTVIDRQRVYAASIPTGTAPADVDVSPDGFEAWVANSGSHTITILSVRRDRKLADFFAGALRPVRLQFTPSGREVWVLHQGTPEITIFHAFKREQIGRVVLPGVPSDILFSNDGLRAYVTLPTGVVAVDTETREVVRTFERAADRSFGTWRGH